MADYILSIPNTTEARREQEGLPVRGHDWVLSGGNLVANFGASTLKVTHAELLIAHSGTLYYVEFKTRQNLSFGSGTSSVYYVVDTSGASPTGSVQVGGSPSQPYLELGTVDASEQTTSTSNRDPTYSVTNTERASIGGLPQVGDPYDAVVAANDPSSPDSTDYTYYNGGRRGTRGRSTNSDFGSAINEFFLDYSGNDDANLEDTPGVCVFTPGVHIPTTPISPRRGCYAYGMRALYKRDTKGGVNDVGGNLDEYITTIWNRDLGTDDYVIEFPDPTDGGVTVGENDGYGAGFGYCHIVGERSNEKDFVKLKNTDTAVLEGITFAETGGTALFNSGSFSIVATDVQFQDCGEYSGGGSTDNPAVLVQSDPDTGQSANMKLEGAVFRGETSDAGTQIRAPQSCQLRGRRSTASVKMENDAAIPAIEGQNLALKDMFVTGLNQAGPIGIKITGGKPSLKNVTVEKIGTGIEVSGYSDKEIYTWEGVNCDLNAEDGILCTGTTPPKLVNSKFRGNGRDAIRLTSDLSNFASVELENPLFQNNTGWCFNDNRNGSQETSPMRFENVKIGTFNDIGLGIYDNPRYISYHSGDGTAVDPYLRITVSDGSTTGTAEHDLYRGQGDGGSESGWAPVAVEPLTPTDANGAGVITDIVAQDNDSDGYKEDIQITLDTAPSGGDAVFPVRVLGRTRIGGDSATAPSL